MAVAGLAIAVFAGACGDDEQEARVAVEKVQRALAAGDIEAACDGMTSDAQRHVGEAAHDAPRTCERDMVMIYEGLKKGQGLREAPSRRVRSVELDGDRGKARVAVGGGMEIDVPVAKEDGEWKVDALYGDLPADEQKDVFK